jgi:hypothetical protein
MAATRPSLASRSKMPPKILHALLHLGEIPLEIA